MALAHLPMQPTMLAPLNKYDVVFELYKEYIQLATDRSSWQFALSLSDFYGRSVLADFGTDTVGANWAAGGDPYEFDGNGTVSATDNTISFDGLSTYKSYKIVANITSVGAGIVWMRNSTPTSVGYVNPGNYTFFINTENTAGTWGFRINDGEIANVTIVSIQEGEYIPQEIVAGATSDLFDFVVASSDIHSTSNRGLIDYRFATNSALEGCYFLHAVDPMSNAAGLPSPIGNEEFTSNADWIATPNTGGTITFANDRCTITSSNQPPSIAQNTLTIGKVYVVTIQIAANSNGSVIVKNGSTTLATYSLTTGAYRVAFKADSVNFTVTMNTIFPDNLMGAALDYVRVREISTIGWKSHQVKYSPIQSYNSIVGIQCFNMFGLNFADFDFKPQIQLDSYIGSEAPTINSFQSLAINGKQSTHYARLRRNYSIKIGFEPFFVHEWLASLFAYNQLFINKSEYYVNESDEYQLLNADEILGYGQSTILLSLQNELIERKAIDEDTDCNIVGLGEFNADFNADFNI